MRHCWSKLGAVAGLTLTVLGIFLLLGFPAILFSVIHKDLCITKGSFAFRMWQSPPVPIYMDVYFFNVTNPQAFLHNGAKPVLVETGPYTYRVWLDRDDVHWHENGTISFRLTKMYRFEPNMSAGSEDDIITTLNVPMLTMAALARNACIVEKAALSFMLSVLHEKLFVRHTVGDLLFHGYADPLTVIGRTIIPTLPDTNGHFGWFYGTNATDQGVLTSFTGVDGLNLLNVVDMWNGQSELPFWKRQPCNELNGTDGIMNPPVADSKEPVFLFHPELCRVWSLQQVEDSRHRGIRSRRFSAPAYLLANGTDNPENACFDTGRHLRSGVMDISPCKFGAPIAVSLPHFYLADPAYVNAVVGLQPNATFHQFYLDTEPMTGLTTEMAARLQLNLMLERVPGIRQFENIPELVFPILWQDLRATITESIADELEDKVFRPKYYTMIAGYCLIAVGVVVICCALVAYLLSRRREAQETEPLIDPSGKSAEYGSNGHAVS